LKNIEFLNFVILFNFNWNFVMLLLGAPRRSSLT